MTTANHSTGRACDKIDPFSRELGVRGGTSVYVGLGVRAHSQKATDLTAREGASMNTRKLRSTLIGSLGVALALASGSALAISFRLTDLGTLGGTSSEGADLNASGQVTGTSATAGGEAHAFLWDGTTMQDLGTLGGTYSDGVAINDSGQVTGSPTRPAMRPFTPSCGTARRCRTSARWGARVVGRCHQRLGAGDGLRRTTGDGVRHAFLWDGTTMQDLGTLGGTFSVGAAINDSGQVTGDSRTAGVPLTPSCGTARRCWTSARWGARLVAALAINASGQVTGIAATADGGASRLPVGRHDDAGPRHAGGRV